MRSKKQHHLTLSPVHNSWKSMLQRCYNRNNPAYKNYGSRGIRVCESWLQFNNFFADMGQRPAGMMLERVNNQQGYSAENCKWATRSEQNNNTRRTILIKFNGITQSVAAWSKQTGISAGTLYSRVYAAWSPKEVVTRTPTPLPRKADILKH